RQELQRLLDGLLSHQERARTAVEQRRHEGGAGPAGRDLDDVVDVLTAVDVLSQRLAENLDRIQDLERRRVDAVTAGTTAYEQSLRPDAPADRSELFDAGR